MNMIKQEGLYQNKVNSSLVCTGNCQMDYQFVIISTAQSRSQGPPCSLPQISDGALGTRLLIKRTYTV